MSGPVATRLLLALWIPAILSATCNPKRGDDGKPPETTPPPEVDVSTTEAIVTPVPETTEIAGCPGAKASAGPLGPQVGPLCGGPAAKIDSQLGAALDKAVAGLGTAQTPVTPSLGADLTAKPKTVGSAVLQGPPHCYTLVSACSTEVIPKVKISSPGSTIEHEGTDPLQICPASTSSFTIDLSLTEGEGQCAVRILGD